MADSSATRTPDEVADQLEPDSAAALLLWENTWLYFVSALAETGGVVVDQGVVPAATAEGAECLDQPGGGGS